MSLSLCVLGSGSAGNCTLLQMENGRGCHFALIDCGLTMRQTTQRLAPLGLALADIDDILLTHLDRDHFSLPWARALQRHDITLHVHHRHRTAAIRAGVPGDRLDVFDDGFELDDATSVESMLFAHDSLGTVGFLIEHDGRRLGYATDLGRIPDFLYDRFRGLHALALESNYDRLMQLSSNRPAFLKQRIMGGAGHLSNMQCFEAVTRIAAQSKLSQIVLLHLSQQCNDPRLITSHYASACPELLDRLTLSNQFEPTALLAVHKKGRRGKPVEARNGQQLAMFNA
ncbi:MAG: MBL fold metallo-hydrolase [Planctomycetes bacterium]|nr:MBL fold metallo-hydrolase [Planctomycetota bacterium]